MKKIILKYSTGAGLLIYAIFNIVNRIVPIKDYIAIPTCIVSIAFMMIGVAYHGWCFGKRKNPYK